MRSIDISEKAGSLPRLFQAQRAAFAAGRPDYDARMAALHKFERALLSRKNEIIQAVSADFNGRAAEETLALELFPLLSEIRHARRHLKSWMSLRRARVDWPFLPGKARVAYRPLGVVGILSSWNYPVFLTFAPMIGAIAAGNHVLLKPSELAPATSAMIAGMVEELYDPAYLSVVTGGPEVASAFVQLPFDHILFTGSTRVGRMVMKAASENLVPVTLELGGKSPVIVHPSYPLSVAVPRILTGKLYNAGQTCVAPDYLVLQPEQLPAFVESAKREISRMYASLVGNPDYTRIINVQQYRRLTALIDDARRNGAEVIAINPAGEACNESNRVFPPTLLLNVRDDMAVMQEEIFGPILPIVTRPDIEDAIAEVNARPHPLALYYFDDDAGRAESLLSRTPAGGVTLNDCVIHAGVPAIPFGGVGASGMGRYHGFDGFQTFSSKQGIFIQRRWSPLAFLRPPYGATARRILKFLVR